MKKTQTSNSKPNLHSGHRQRLKNKFVEFGLDSFNEHEVLELILTYAIPYKDTNELAHNLLNMYGSIYDVCNAKYEDLIANRGIKRESAIFLNLLAQFSDYMYSKKDRGNIKSLNNIKSIISYFRKKHIVKDKEEFFCLCLSSNYALIKEIKIEGIDDLSVSFDFKLLLSQITATHCSSVVFIHTHPHGQCIPSKEDIDITFKLLVGCKLLGIELSDHIIFNEDDYYSMKNEIENMYNSYHNNIADVFQIDYMNVSKNADDDERK